MNKRIAVLVLMGMMLSGRNGARGAGAVGVDLAAMQGWDVVVAADASPSEKYAAEEFRNFFGQASGLTLPMVSSTDRSDRHVFIGAGPAMAKSNVGFAVDGFGPEDLRIIVRDNNIAIAGGRPRGTLYGVYTFLEDYVGVRFLTADHTYVPKTDGWRVVGPVDRFYHPPLGFRWSFYSETNSNPVLATRRRTNTVAEDAKLGGKTPMVLINHSFAELIPSRKYGKEHPEYFSEINGKRLAAVGNDSFDTEPCLTNPQVLKIVTKAVLDRLAADPKMECISVSQNDNDKYCRCAQCAALDAREGTPMGSLLTFVNAVADEVAKQHPGVTVGTLSYWYSRKPPKTIKPRPNVRIQLCSIECCIVHPINDPKCAKNAEFCRDSANWGKICNNIAIWNYDTNFSNYQLPFPNLRGLEPNVRYFVANHALGVFMQAAYTSMGAEMSDLRNYVISNLLWDPNRSGGQLVDEFITLHYGRAGDPIREYIHFYHDHAEAMGVHPNCFGSGKDHAVDQAVAQASLKAFGQAMGLAENDTVRTRVEKASIGAYRAAIEPVWNHDGRKSLDPATAARMRPLVKKFFELSHKYGVTMIGEGEKLEDREQRVKKALGIGDGQSF